MKNIVGNIRKKKRDSFLAEMPQDKKGVHCVQKRWETRKIMIVHELDND